MYRSEVVHPDLVSLIGAAPDGASHWGLQKRKRGGGEREGWSTLAFPPTADGVCRHEVPVSDLSLDTIRGASEGAAGVYRVKWLAEDESGLKQAGMGRTFTLAAEADDAPPAAPVASPVSFARRSSAAAPQPDVFGLMLAMMAADRESAKEAREREDREARERREERREREEREDKERRRREDADREERKAALQLERERLEREYQDRARQTEALTKLAEAITKQGERVEALVERVEQLEDEADDDDDEEPPEGKAEDPMTALVRESAPLAKRALEAVVTHFAPAAE